MKERLDVLLVKLGLAESREKAKAVIMSGIVYVDGEKEDKAGTTFEENANIEVRGNTLRYVSRGGLKLEKAMTQFGLSLEGRVCMDVGSSTGGFTDCMEKTNIRYVTPEDLADPIEFSSIDVSFISLTKVLGPVKALLTDEGEVVCLIKPQFEAGREKVGKKGVVREKSVHLEVIRMVISHAASIGFEVLHLEYSPIKGPEGNIEYLLHLKNHRLDEACPERDPDPEKVVKEAHGALTGRESGQLQASSEADCDCSGR